MADGNMRAAIAAALAEDTEETADTSAEVTVDEAAATDDAQSDDSTESNDTTDEATSTDDTADEGPDEYFGVKLTGLSKEDRDAVIAGFQERDKFIQQLLRNKPEDAAEESTTDSEAADTEEVGDDAILKALGLDDPDDPYAQNTAKVAVPLTKLVLELQDEVASLKGRTDADATERYWTSQLTQLERDYGPLPISHEELMRQAATAGVAEPVDAYWRVAGPARQQVMAEVTKRREALATARKAEAKGNVRPKDEAAGSEVIEKFADVRDATKSAITSLLKEKGIALEENE